ncbi:MAG: YraN family protein [Clostridia bacterium]|nr:YraN family protein [Clostridia bacterium]
MSRYKKDLGDFGEKVAESFYRDHGYRILCKNYSVSSGELDLIVESDNCLVFVEVKTRRNLNYGYPAEAITQKKLLHMKRAAEEYLLRNPYEKEIRFDAVEVLAVIVDGVPQLESINHIPNILL